MSTLNPKKAAARLESRSALPSPAAHTSSAATGLNNGRIQRKISTVKAAVDLGNGFYLVEVDQANTTTKKAISKAAGRMPAKADSAVATAFLDADVPPVPMKTVKKLLAQFNESVSNPNRSAGPRAASVADASTPRRRRAASHTSGEQIASNATMDALWRESAQRRIEALQDGRLLTSNDVQERRAITRQALSKAVKDYRAFWLDGPSGMQLYPAYLVKPDAERQRYEKVSRSLGDLAGAEKWAFFTTPKQSLGGQTPADALDKGQLDDVINTAELFVERR